VKDAVTGYMSLAEALTNSALQGQALNFGTDEPKAVLEIVEAIIAASEHPELEPIILNEAPNEVQAQYLSSAKSRELLGWEPAYTLDEALHETFRWYQAFLECEAR
jgi:CDP-glucose 4,6-dehydratase